MGPVKKYYIRSVEKYIRNNPGRAITVFQFISSAANSEATQQSIVVNGFRECEIDAIDRQDYNLLSSNTTDVVLAKPETQQNECDKEEETLAAMPPMLDPLLSTVLH